MKCAIGLLGMSDVKFDVFILKVTTCHDMLNNVAV